MFFFKFFFLRYKICSSLKKKKKKIQICNSSRRRWPVSTLETASFEKQIGGNITNVPARIISQDFKIIKGHNRIANIRVWEIKHYNSIQFNLRERERYGGEESSSRHVSGVVDVFVQHSHCRASRPRHCPQQSLSFFSSIFRPIRFVHVFIHGCWCCCLQIAVYPATSVTDLSAVDAALKGMELQLHSIKDRLRDETLAIPKAKVPLSLSLSLCVSIFLWPVAELGFCS